jgi:hypothetical protein
VSFGPKSFFLLWDAIQSVQPYGFGIEIKVASGMDFEEDFNFMFIIYGSYGTVRTVYYAHRKRGTEVVVQLYGFGMENEADLCGTDLVL